MKPLPTIFSHVSVPRVTGTRVAWGVIGVLGVISHLYGNKPVEPRKPQPAEIPRVALEQPLPSPASNLIQPAAKVCGRGQIPSGVQLHCRGEIIYGVQYETIIYKFQDAVMQQDNEICDKGACANVNDGRVNTEVRKVYKDWQKWREAGVQPN